MKSWKKICGAIVLLFLPVVAAYAQDATVEELKSKGAQVLSADEVKALIVGATQRYENAQFRTQMTVNADGSLNGSARRRIGSGQTTAFVGKWRVTDDGRFCAETETQGQFGGGAKYCRDIFKVGDKYYYAAGDRKNDARPANEMTISK